MGERNSIIDEMSSYLCECLVPWRRSYARPCCCLTKRLPPAANLGVVPDFPAGGPVSHRILKPIRPETFLL